MQFFLTLLDSWLASIRFYSILFGAIVISLSFTIFQSGRTRNASWDALSVLHGRPKPSWMRPRTPKSNWRALFCVSRCVLLVFLFELIFWGSYLQNPQRTLLPTEKHVSFVINVFAQTCMLIEHRKHKNETTRNAIKWSEVKLHEMETRW